MIKRRKQQELMTWQLWNTGVRPPLPIFRWAFLITVVEFLVLSHLICLRRTNLDSTRFIVDVLAFWRFLTMRKNWKRWRTWLGRSLLLLFEGERAIWLFCFLFFFLFSCWFCVEVANVSRHRWFAYPVLFICVCRKSSGFSRGASMYRGVTRFASLFPYSSFKLYFPQWFYKKKNDRSRFICLFN